MTDIFMCIFIDHLKVASKQVFEIFLERSCKLRLRITCQR